MVKLCYIFPFLYLTPISQCFPTQTQLKINDKNPVLREHNIVDLHEVKFIHPQIIRRSVSYKDAKNNKSGAKQRSTENNEDNESEESNEEGDEIINSYGFRNFQKKFGLGDKKFEIPVKEAVPDWEDQYYYDDGRPVVYEVDTEELKEIMDNYIDIGKEKWAAFLATSDCNKFQKFIKKLTNILHKNEGEETSNMINSPDVNKNVNNEEDTDDDNDDDITDELTWGETKKISETYPMINQVKLKKQKGLKKSYEQQLRQELNRQPHFSIMPQEELEEFQQLFSDVVSYWEKEDAKTILEAAHGLTYKDFEFDEEETEKGETNFNFNDSDSKKKTSVKPDKSENLIKSSTSIRSKSTKTAKANSKVIESNQNGYSEYEDNEYSDDRETNVYGGDHYLDNLELLNKMDPKFFKTKEQKEWLKENALRRAHIIQNLLNGEFEDEDTLMAQDLVRYRENNIFLDEDDNEFASDGFKLQSTNMAMYVFFLVEAILFYIF